jgi:hypothetical protein
MSEVAPQPNRMFVCAEIKDIARFAVGLSVLRGERIADPTWKAIEEYGYNTPQLYLPEDLTTPTLPGIGWELIITPTDAILSAMHDKLADIDPWYTPINTALSDVRVLMIGSNARNYNQPEPPIIDLLSSGQVL